MDVRISCDEFLNLDLEVHAFLKEVPLHDVSAINLPAGGERTVADIRALTLTSDVTKSNVIVAALFTLRYFIGSIFGWDKEPLVESDSYLSRLDTELREKSLIEPGTMDGSFRLLYLFPHESVSEIKNATVHAFLCSALIKIDSGYRLYWAVYVKPVSGFTSFYMAVIDPFRRFLVYPAILNKLRTGWIQKYGDI